MGQLQVVNARNRNKKEKKSGGVAFFLSILFHVSILLLIGGVVLIPAVVQKSVFVSAGGDLIQSDTVMDIPPDTSQNDLPNSQVPQETMALPDQNNPVTPTDIVVARQDSSMASSSWASSVAKAPAVTAKMPTFANQDQSNRDDSNKEVDKKVNTSATRITLFGSTDKAESNGIEGSFYDASRRSTGTPTNRSWAEIRQLIYDSVDQFVRGNRYAFRDFYKSPQQLFASTYVIPNCNNQDAFDAFNEKQVTKEPALIIHYSGNVASTKDITFRFAGVANYLIVMVDKNLVWKGMGYWKNYNEDTGKWEQLPPVDIPASEFKWNNWSPTDISMYRFQDGKPSGFRYTFGTWLKWKANEFHQIDIIIASAGSLKHKGIMNYLCVQDKSADYKIKIEETKIPGLPLFRIGKKDKSEEFLKKGKVMIDMLGINVDQVPSFIAQ